MGGSHKYVIRRISCTKLWLLHSQVVGQVVLLQGVGFKPMRRPVEVVIPDAADEAFSLSRAESVCVCGGRLECAAFL